MALLQYNNLNNENPKALLSDVFNGVKPFRDYLKRTKDYLKSDAAVLRLAWRSVEHGDTVKADDTDGSCWIELIEPADRPNEPDGTFRAFLDDDEKEVYEFEPASETEPESRMRLPAFSKESKIRILDRDPKENRLRLERKPEASCLLLRPNTYQIERQMDALAGLRDTPESAHLPLLKLFASRQDVSWLSDSSSIEAVSQWDVLTEESRDGTAEQQRFVECALNTPDFALLEGPPGSGKTTALCELILQFARRGKRVLLCASTHVAVDNVLERLMDPGLQPAREHILSIRIGDRKNVSELAAARQLETVVKNEQRQIRQFLGKLQNPSESQRLLLSALDGAGPELFQELILSAANLVCGTTIGILQHPEFKQSRHAGYGFTAKFDVLILDEASKTTFQEFLVPAMLAKRWIIVGDHRQLSPYVDEDAMAVNAKACLPDAKQREECLNLFLSAESKPVRAEAGDDPLTWEHEMAWRLTSLHDLRLSPGNKSQRLASEISRLLPPHNGEDIRNRIDQLRRVALPSVLECLLRGFDTDRAERHRNTLTDGFTSEELDQRHVRLSFQHRMHPDIAAFSRTHIYAGAALKDPQDMAQRRQFGYAQNQPRSVWLDVEGRFLKQENRNPEEARVVLDEIKRFAGWASQTANARPLGAPWEVAVLTPYRGQERELRAQLREATGEHRSHRIFNFGSGVRVELCTVDRFQGHEADVVFLSFARTHSTYFLESVNRLNVALTRARYYRVIVGDRKALAKSREGIIKTLAESEQHWEKRIPSLPAPPSRRTKPIPPPPPRPGPKHFPTRAQGKFGPNIDIDITALHSDETATRNRKGGRK